MTYMLVNAVKEQQAQLEDKQTQIDQLKKENAELLAMFLETKKAGVEVMQAAIQKR